MRALLLSGPVGNSHLEMARSLEADILEREPTASVVIRNDFGVLGPLLGRVLGGGYTYHLGGARKSYDAAYALFTGVRAMRTLGELALMTLGGRALAAEVARERPDVVVATHPVLNAVVGRLRAAGRIPCPVAVVVGPLGGLGFWIQPGADLHLLNYAEATPDVEREAGPGSARPVRPLVRAEFFAAPPRDRARAELGIDHDRRIILISGGGWGAGDLEGAVGAALAVPDADVITVAGRNERLRQAIAARGGDDGRLTVLGFTTQMRELLAAADVFVTATAGLSCLEAQLCGCPTVWYGFAVGHVRDNVAALERNGLARAARSPAALTEALVATLADGSGAGAPPRAQLPRGGDVLLDLARSRDPGRRSTRIPA